MCGCNHVCVCVCVMLCAMFGCVPCKYLLQPPRTHTSHYSVNTTTPHSTHAHAQYSVIFINTFDTISTQIDGICSTSHDSHLIITIQYTNQSLALQIKSNKIKSIEHNRICSILSASTLRLQRSLL